MSAVEQIADWRIFQTAETIATVSSTADTIHLTWSDGRQSPYDRFWLRDNCSCAACYLASTREQTFEIVDAPDTLAVQETELDAEKALLVLWSDGHRSRYDSGWLRINAYDDARRAERRSASPSPVLWGAARADVLPTFAYDSVMSDDGELLRWLVAVRDIGLTLIQGVPTEPKTLLGVAHRISHIRETNFGTVFNVASKPNPDSSAYTAVNLPPHTDLPTRELQPGVQFLHCLVNETTGGESIFVDGFAIADAMAQEAPAELAMLTDTPMEFWNRDSRTDYRWSGPLISRDGEGHFSEVRFANFLRGPIDAPTDIMPGLYRALRLFQSMSRDARFRVERKLAPGDMWVFDNRRVLHARRAFDPMSGNRHLQGVYVDRDELRSRIRVLERELGA
ncbi:TauD/TfdA family dioxygenase [Acidisoma cladoniae]|jgi:gamma-butyrobetaine dioxygenase|uniref:TauD/TfdA family dioxygenase n=1 Tax=Acidisoma cladoniae TaxID=3040935 RepID=UPI0025501438|nr:TauD/TfdA family dioxygenase [Acidisoma sp. PAMC 29798]